jgi:hypothetical protein
MKQQTLLVDGHLNAAKAPKRLCSSGDLLHFLSERPKAALTTSMQRKPKEVSFFWRFTAFPVRATQSVPEHLNAAKAQKKLASSGVLLHFLSERPKAALTTSMQRKPKEVSFFWRFTAFPVRATQSGP